MRALGKNDSSARSRAKDARHGPSSMSSVTSSTSSTPSTAASAATATATPRGSGSRAHNGFRVVVRLRPPTGAPSCVTWQETVQPPVLVVRAAAGATTTSSSNSNNNNNNDAFSFSFPCVLSGQDSARDTAQLHADVLEPLVQSVLEGYHATLFAYGATGSGKTYSMNSCQEHVIGTLFQAQNRGTLLGVQVSCVELYNEEFRDLLAPTTLAETASLTLRQDAREGPLLEPLTRVTVRSAEHMHQILDKARQRRQTAPTEANERSSRSHALVTFYVHTAAAAVTATAGPGHGNGNGNSATLTKLHLVDLAGSERQLHSRDAKRQQEAIHINTSLTALGQVILALSKREDFVPYRRSMLTRFLQDALGGQAFSVMIAHVRTDVAFIDTTVTTLRYAAQALRIENTPKRSTIQAVHDPSAIDILLPALPQLCAAAFDLQDTLFQPPAGAGGSGGRARRQSLGDPVVSSLALSELRRILGDQERLWAASMQTLQAVAPGDQVAGAVSALQQKQQRFQQYAASLLTSLEADIQQYRETLDALQRVVQRKQLLVDLCVSPADRDWVDTHCEWVPTMRTYVVAMNKWAEHKETARSQVTAPTTEAETPPTEAPTQAETFNQALETQHDAGSVTHHDDVANDMCNVDVTHDDATEVVTAYHDDCNVTYCDTNSVINNTQHNDVETRGVTETCVTETPSEMADDNVDVIDSVIDGVIDEDSPGTPPPPRWPDQPDTVSAMSLSGARAFAEGCTK